MTEFENNGQAPLSPENDKDEKNSFRLYAETPESPDQDLTHCRVPLSAWFGETKTFCRRYFWRLFFLSLILSILSFLGQDMRKLVNTESSNGDQTALNIVTSIAEAQEESDTGVSADGEETIDFFDRAVEENAENPAEKTDADMAGEKEESSESGADAAASGCSKGGCACCFGNGKYSSFFGTVAMILQLMVLGWTIRTIQRDNGDWRNLAFPSWTTIFKAIAVVIFFLLLILAALFFVFGLLSPLLAKLPVDSSTIQCFLLLIFLILVFIKFALSISLVVDRDFGPLRALGHSWKFMRTNGGTLFLGMMIFIFVFGVLVFLITIPLATLVFTLVFRHLEPAKASSDAVLTMIRNTPALCWGSAAYYILVGTLATVWTMGFTSVFYLMATGQSRPGAWPRDVEPVDEPSDTPAA